MIELSDATEIVNSAWPLDAGEAATWEQAVAQLDPDKVLQAVHVLQSASPKRPSVGIFLATYRGLEVKEKRAVAARNPRHDWFEEQREKLRKAGWSGVTRQPRRITLTMPLSAQPERSPQRP
jgi:hypothetical protein